MTPHHSGGLYEEFFKELKDGLVAFMDPDVYGRPPIECSSFIASSAHPDETIHGQGYLARLSGSTAEFLSMWNLMMMGAQPFVDFQVEDVDSGGSFAPQPTIKASTGEVGVGYRGVWGIGSASRTHPTHIPTYRRTDIPT